MRQALRKEDLERPITTVDGVDAATANRLGAALSVGEALSMDLTTLRERSGLGPKAAVELRNKLLGRQ